VTEQNISLPLLLFTASAIWENDLKLSLSFASFAESRGTNRLDLPDADSRPSVTPTINCFFFLWNNIRFFRRTLSMTEKLDV